MRVWNILSRMAVRIGFPAAAFRASTAFRVSTAALVSTAFLVPGCGGKDDSEPAASTGPLEPRMPFPSVSLQSLEGEPVSTTDIIDGRDVIVFFVSLGCESCETLLGAWRPLLHEIPEDVAVFAIADEDPDFAREYARMHDFPIPLYCDERGVFNREHGVEVFPTVVGATAGGSIAFVGEAVTPLFTPEKALDLLEQVKTARGES